MSLLASCYSTADGIGNLRQLHVRHTMRAAITHPPYERLAAFSDRMGLTYRFFSSAGRDFYYDFHATVGDPVTAVQIFHRSEAEMAETNMPWNESLRGDWRP